MAKTPSLFLIAAMTSVAFFGRRWTALKCLAEYIRACHAKTAAKRRGKNVEYRKSGMIQARISAPIDSLNRMTICPRASVTSSAVKVRSAC